MNHATIPAASPHLPAVGTAASFAPALAYLRHAIDEHAIVAVTDRAGRIVEVNDRFCTISKYTREELIGKDHRLINSGHHPKSFFKEMWATVLQGRVWRGDIRNRAKDGFLYWVQTTIVPMFDAQSRVSHLVSLRTDITEQKSLQEALLHARYDLEIRVAQRTEALHISVAESIRQKEALAKSEERYALAARGSNDGLWDWDLQRNEIFLSERWKRILGIDGPSGITGPAIWFDRIHPYDLCQLEADIEICRSRDGSHLRNEHRLRHEDGTWRHVLCTALLVRNDDGTARRLVGSIADISQRKSIEARLLHEATHDSLTGLPNRTLFRHRLDHCIQHARTDPAHQFAVLFLDLDRFKTINDGLGHHVGDELLKRAGRILRDCVRPTESASFIVRGHTVARMGGDEFTILLDAITEKQQVIDLARKVQDALSTPMVIDGHEVCTSASIGIRFYDDTCSTAEDLLRDADTAMYHSKAAGKARHTCFDEPMYQLVKSKLQLESDLRKALDQGELQMFYQPIVSLVDGSVLGFESLLRWRHPVKGMVSPVDFIPLAEESGLINPIGKWALEESIRQLALWDRQYPAAMLTISINISRKQLADNAIVNTVASAIRRHGLAAHRVRLEVTESVMVENMHSTSSVLEQLKALGVQLHMDDFGTGYSSLSCLHRFPLDGLKIDRAFIVTMGDRTDYAAVVYAIITLAHNLRMRVIAEGIETPEQLAQLQALDCDAGQGYYFSAPMAAQEIDPYLAQRLYRAAIA